MMFYTIAADGLQVAGAARLCLPARDAYEWSSQHNIDGSYYLGSFWLTTAFYELKLKTGSTNGYDGDCWSPWLRFDLDCKENPDKAKTDLIRLCDYFLKIGFSEDDLFIFLSGYKGFHLDVPMFGDVLWSVDFNRKCKSLAIQLASELGLETLDVSLYEKNRLFRCPNSRHEKSGLYKRKFALCEIKNKSLLELQKDAESPLFYRIGGFEKPTPAVMKQKWYGIELDAAVEDMKQPIPKAKVGYYPPSRLNRETLDFIVNGAEEGEREHRLFKCIANLWEIIAHEEFDGLVHSLIKEAAEECGLPPSKIEDCLVSGKKQGMRSKV